MHIVICKYIHCILNYYVQLIDITEDDLNFPAASSSFLRRKYYFLFSFYLLRNLRDYWSRIVKKGRSPQLKYLLQMTASNLLFQEEQRYATLLSDTEADYNLLLSHACAMCNSDIISADFRTVKMLMYCYYVL